MPCFATENSYNENRDFLWKEVYRKCWNDPFPGGLFCVFMREKEERDMEAVVFTKNGQE